MSLLDVELKSIQLSLNISCWDCFFVCVCVVLQELTFVYTNKVVTLIVIDYINKQQNKGSI